MKGRKMRSNKYLLTGILLMGSAMMAHGSLIASESFWTTTINPPPNSQYLAGSIGSTTVGSPAYNNTVVVAGSTGFNAANPWVGTTGNIALVTNISLTHNGLAGSSATGSIQLTPFATGTDRNSSRALAATPSTSSSYYMSGLIRGTTVAADGKAGTAGFMPSVAVNTFDISTGIHMGVHVEGGELKIAAFANNQTYNLVNLSTVGLTTVHQVVLRLDVDDSGDETLSAWYAIDGATSLTQGLAPTNIGDFWSSAGDLGTFALQIRAAGASNQIVGFIDEMRFGTSLSDVTVIPEPATIGMLGVSFVTLFLRRRFK